MIYDRAKKFSLRYSVRTFCTMGTGGNSSGINAVDGRRGWGEADHSPTPSAQVKMSGAITPLPHTPLSRVSGKIYFLPCLYLPCPGI